MGGGRRFVARELVRPGERLVCIGEVPVLEAVLGAPLQAALGVVQGGVRASDQRVDA